MDLLTLGTTLHKPLPFLLSCLVACGLSIWPGNRLVFRLHQHFVRRIADEATLPIEMRSEHDTIGASFIGRIERPIYILAIMFAQSSIVTAVIILKAFFNWTDVYAKDAGPGKEGEAKTGYDLMIMHYHAYVIGNLLSLALALALAELGIHAFPRLIRDIGAFAAKAMS